MPRVKVTICSEILARQGLTIAFIESATAGRMCSEFALTENSGDILRGGLASYDASVKEEILKIPHDLIAEYTPESAEVTKAMAISGGNLFKADVTVAVTGLTTPGGSETAEKPVGTIFLHIITPSGEVHHREVFSAEPEEIILRAIDRAASLVTNNLTRT